ncbi:MAG TPA: type II toxin-antitoxin system RelE/ParE family toxin [Polyangiaceae bacterium]|nr:type II toxin-antitoxin system RelE/ParE family toxin [Polyangiaceae bacterium]
MARVVYSPRAKRDITEVLEYTRERWGKEQAREYGELIRAALRAVAATPRRGKPRPALGPGLFAYHIGQPGRPARHVLFYRVGADATDAVEIVRLLHDAMDFGRHLP